MHSDSVMIQEENVMTKRSIKRIGYFMIKRAFDLFVGILGMLILIPLAIVIKIISVLNKDYHSIFFKQKRIGKNGKLFTMYKFRTMIPNADEVLQELMKTDKKFNKEYTLNKKVKNDPRITKIGRILRKTSLDEIPQFINVFLGDMSLIGNRPYLPREKEDMGKYYNEIVKTKPGITGYWQVSGKEHSTFNQRLKLESFYSKNHGFKMDCKIFFKTFGAVIHGHGAAE